MSLERGGWPAGKTPTLSVYSLWTVMPAKPEVTWKTLNSKFPDYFEVLMGSLPTPVHFIKANRPLTRDPVQTCGLSSPRPTAAESHSTYNPNWCWPSEAATHLQSSPMVRMKDTGETFALNNTYHAAGRLLAISECCTCCKNLQKNRKQMRSCKVTSDGLCHFNKTWRSEAAAPADLAWICGAGGSCAAQSHWNPLQDHPCWSRAQQSF